MVIFLSLFLLLISMDNTLFKKKLSVIELSFFLLYILSRFSGNYFLDISYLFTDFYLNFYPNSDSYSFWRKLVQSSNKVECLYSIFLPSDFKVYTDKSSNTQLLYASDFHSQYPFLPLPQPSASTTIFCITNFLTCKTFISSLRLCKHHPLHF